MTRDEIIKMAFATAKDQHPMELARDMIKFLNGDKDSDEVPPVEPGKAPPTPVLAEDLWGTHISQPKTTKEKPPRAGYRWKELEKRSTENLLEQVETEKDFEEVARKVNRTTDGIYTQIELGRLVVKSKKALSVIFPKKCKIKGEE